MTLEALPVRALETVTGLILNLVHINQRETIGLQADLRNAVSIGGDLDIDNFIILTTKQFDCLTVSFEVIAGYVASSMTGNIHLSGLVPSEHCVLQSPVVGELE